MMMIVNNDNNSMMMVVPIDVTLLGIVTVVSPVSINTLRPKYEQWLFSYCIISSKK